MRRQVFGFAAATSFCTESPDAVIYYTTNGATPTTDSPIYDGPIELDDATNLRALAVADGLADSAVTAAVFRFPGEDCRTVADTWQSTPSSRQTGTFEFEFEATPQSETMNSVMGLSDGDAQRYQDLAAIARFSPDGVIDARNGGDYEAQSSLVYEASTTYRFRFVVDIGAGVYDVYVTPKGEDEAVINADGFDFRTEQTAVFRLNRFSSFAADGENLICNLAMPAELMADDSDQDGDNDGEGDDTVGDNDGQDDGDDANDDTDPGTDDDVDDVSGSGEESPQSDDSTTTSSTSSCSSVEESPVGALLLFGLMGLWCFASRRRRLPAKSLVSVSGEGNASVQDQGGQQ